MASASKEKPKADPGQKTGPSIPVEETPHAISREERPFRLNRKERLQNLSPIPLSHSRAASRDPSERGKSQEYLPVLETTANSNIGDKNRSVEIENYTSETFKPPDRWMGFERASEEVIVDAEHQSFPMSTSEEIAEQTPQDSVQASKHHVQAMRTIGEGVFREKLDKGKGRENEGLHEAGGLASIQPRQDYDNSGTPEADDRETPRHQLPGFGVPSTQDVAYNYSIHGGTYDIPNLNKSVSFNAIHDSSAQDLTRRVHPGTRQHILKRIRDWIDNPRATEPIFWLHGPAGIGKSAIAQTIAQSCAREKLAATFFFYRSDPSRNDGNRLFTTLAWQFAHSIPATKNALIHSLNERPDIPMTDVETQFEELIVKPFLALKMSGVQLSAPVVIVDGVDECSDDDLQRRILKIIGNAVKDDRIPLRFLICSRPETHIQDTIDIFQYMTLPLDLAKLDAANYDIEKYFRAEFSRIATEQDLDPAWPGEQIIQEFVYKASGQFIYAFTVIKCVGDESSSAETQLDIIRGLKPASSIPPFAELDELYKEILRRQRDPAFLNDFLSLLIGRNETWFDGLDEDDAMLLDVSEKELHRKLRGMCSLLRFEPYIDVHHRSFLDFLHDSSRSGEYHISKQAGTRRYLDFIAGSLVRYVSTVIERQDDHETHFSPEFSRLARFYPATIVLPVEEWQQALQPLLDLQNKLLTLPNFRSTWEIVPCRACTGFYTMRHLLLHLAFRLGASDHVLDSVLMAESHAGGSEEIYSIMPLIPTETDTNALEKGLNTCLSSLLPRLRRRKLGISLGTETIQLVCSLLHFDHAEIAMRLRSILDAQSLMNVIDELINNKHFFSDHSPDISCKAVRLALEIYSRVPVLPRSLFSKGTVGPQHHVWPTSRDCPPETELLFQTAFICKVLDPSHIVRVSWVYEQRNRLLSVVDKVDENHESSSQWRKRSKPSSIIRIRVMLEVAKAIQYFHSMGIVLHNHVDSDDIFLDSEFHVRFRFLGLTARYVNLTPHFDIGPYYLSYEANIFLFGCLFYEMCFDVKIGHDDRVDYNSDAVAKRPSRLEIHDDEWQLIQRCCAREPKSRPTMDDIVREMEAWDIT